MPVASTRLVYWLMALCIVSLVAVASATAATADLRIVEAAKQRDVKGVRALVQERVDVNTRQPDGATALHWAAHWNDLETVDLLIRAGADVDAANDLRVTPVFVASTNGHATVVTMLLSAGANPNAALSTGESPLMAAARTGSVLAVQALLAHGAKVAATESSRGQTALMWAVAQRHPEVVRALLAAGADVHARSRVRRHRVFVAGSRNGSGLTPEAVARATKDIDEGGFTPMLFAAQQGDVESARLLLAAGGNVNDAAATGTSALVIAAHSGHAEVGAFLLENGADPNSAGAGYTALHAAVLRGKLDLVKVLLAHGANSNAQVTNATPAKRYGTDWALGDHLIGATPFYLAAKFGELDIMRALAAGGADPLVAMQDGSTPAMVAMDVPTTRSGTLEGFGTDRRDRYVFAHLINADTPEDVENSTRDLVKLAIEAGGDVNATNHTGDTPLHLAASNGFATIAKYLVEKGARLNVVNKRGQTPLAAAMTGLSRTNAGATAAHAGGKATADLLRELGAK